MLKKITYIIFLFSLNIQADFSFFGYTLRPESKIYIPERLAYFAAGSGITLVTCFVASKLMGNKLRKKHKRNLTPEELADLKFKYILAAKQFNNQKDE